MARTRTIAVSQDLVTFAEGAALMGVCKKTLERMLTRPESDVPQPFRTGRGRKRFYRRAHVMAYLERKHAEAQSRDEHALAAFAVPPSMIMHAIDNGNLNRSRSWAAPVAAGVMPRSASCDPEAERGSRTQERT